MNMREKNMERKIKALLCSPSPRDIKQVFDAHAKLDIDKLYAKYFIEREAYWHLRNFFLKHEEYTHLILAPDDLVIEPKDLELLLKDLEEYDYPILSGICNVDMDTMKNYYSITQNIPHPRRGLLKLEDPDRKRNWGYRWYAWYNEGTIANEQFHQQNIPGDDRPEHHRGIIFRVGHSGFALQAIRRDVVERFNFITDAEVNDIENAETSSVDVMYSNTCWISEPQVAIMTDPRIKMLHLRRAGSVEITLGRPEMWHVIQGKKYIYEVPSEPLKFHGTWDKIIPIDMDARIEYITPTAKD